MIVESIFNLLKTLVSGLFGLIPNIPAMPEAVTSALSSAVDTVSQGCDIVAIFLPWSFVIVIMTVYVAFENFDHIYSFLRWIVKKIPFIQIDM